MSGIHYVHGLGTGIVQTGVFVRVVNLGDTAGEVHARVHVGPDTFYSPDDDATVGPGEVWRFGEWRPEIGAVGESWIVVRTDSRNLVPSAHFMVDERVEVWTSPQLGERPVINRRYRQFAAVAPGDWAVFVRPQPNQAPDFEIRIRR